MYLLIEHNGTDGHMKIAETIKEYASNEYGATCEDSVSYDETITLYNDDLTKIAEFDREPTEADLRFYCSLAYNTGD